MLIFFFLFLVHRTGLQIFNFYIFFYILCVLMMVGIATATNFVPSTSMYHSLVTVCTALPPCMIYISNSHNMQPVRLSVWLLLNKDRFFKTYSKWHDCWVGKIREVLVVAKFNPPFTLYVRANNASLKRLANEFSAIARSQHFISS